MKTVDIIVPCYKRPEYTRQCLGTIQQNTVYPNVRFLLINDGSGNDGTEQILHSFLDQNPTNSVALRHDINIGLRNTLIEAFGVLIRGKPADYIVKIDNDCLPPAEWIRNLVWLMENNDVDLLAPDVYPSHPADRFGKEKKGSKLLFSDTIGGNWIMKRDLLPKKGFSFTEDRTLSGAWQLMQGIIHGNKAKTAWTKEVVLQDMGHWSGKHPNHLKSKEHFEYSKEIGREVSWKPK